MDTGTIGFHDQKAVVKVKTEKDREEIKRISKTKVEVDVDFAAERQERDALERQEKKQFAKERRSEEKLKQKEQAKKQAEEQQK